MLSSSSCLQVSGKTFLDAQNQAGCVRSSTLSPSSLLDEVPHFIIAVLGFAEDDCTFGWLTDIGQDITSNKLTSLRTTSR